MNILSSLLEFIGEFIGSHKNATTTTISGGYVNEPWRIRKVGSLVFLHVGVLKAIPSGSFGLGAPIPSGYIPKTESSFTLIRRNQTGTPLAFTVFPSGNISCYNYGTETTAAMPFSQVICWSIV